MKISVIVPAFNEEKLLGASLEAIKSAAGVFATRGGGFELIVCDNNSTDRTGEIARAAGASVVFEPINQIGRARNSGAAAATAGDWLIFVDADSQPSAVFFDDVAKQILSGKYLAGGSTLQLDAKNFTANAVAGLVKWICRWMCLMAGAFIFVEAAAFRRIGGFSNKLFAAEEIDLSRRLKQLGRETGRKMIILHRHPLTTSARKLKLYTPRELLGFFVRTVLNHRRTLSSAEQAHLWYDGRR